MKFYFWTGLQLLIRAIFFGLTALEQNVNLTVGTLLIGALIWLQERVAPFKSKINNYMEILCLFNLLVMFVISLYTSSNDIVVNVLLSLAMLQLMCTILWHIKSVLWCHSTAKPYLPGKLVNCFNILKIEANDKTNRIQLVNEVPGVAYDYKEFQEPLIGL